MTAQLLQLQVAHLRALVHGRMQWVRAGSCGTWCWGWLEVQAMAQLA